MAYRRRSRTTSRRGSTTRRRYSTTRRRTYRTRSRRASTANTLRIVVEQPNAVARPDIFTKAAPKAKKAKF